MKADQPLRILMVEDIPEHAEIAERELRKDGLHFTSVRVETEEGFLREFEAFRPDLVISDYMMPEFDGLQVLKLSLARDPSLPVILLTSSLKDETAVACMKAGAADYIIKEHVTRIPLAVRAALRNLQTRIEKEESEDQLAAIYENAPLIMALLDEERRIHRANSCLAAFSGRSGAALQTERYGAALRCLHALDAPGGCGAGPHCPECTIHRSVAETIETGRSLEHVECELPFNAGAGEEEMTFLLSTKRLYLKRQPLVLVSMLDITKRKRAETALQETLERLRRAVGTTIQVMVSTVETRDPYTAGHQNRSAELAAAIAGEMGLPPERIEGLRMAASIHDIGKLSIPAEILSKPTALSEIEFRLVKEHAGKGFEMLKDVESPWPLAEIVHQHHERMDGTGYPRNLKGEEITIEARILAVADVVEAMASHRPYRAGLGIEAALSEIGRGRGTAYDDAVAGACLRLFCEKGFLLPGI